MYKREPMIGVSAAPFPGGVVSTGACVDGERLPFLAELSAELTRLIDRDAGRVGATAARPQLS